MSPFRRVRIAWAILSFAIQFAAIFSQAWAEDSKLVYIGTYTGPNSRGIYSARFDSNSGKFSELSLAAEMKNPSFLAMHPNGNYLYAVGEVDSFGGKSQGVVSAFAVEKESGKLKLLNEQPSGGSGPCHLAVDGIANCVLVANYGSGSVASLPIKADGKLEAAVSEIQHKGASVNRDRQSGPHAHFIVPDPPHRFVIACDLGLDKVLVYKVDPASGSLTANDTPSISIKPGSGPRHLAMSPEGRFAYLINEMSSTITTLAYDSSHGTFSEVQTISTLPDGFKGKSTCAEVQLHPSGNFVYGSNRGADTIAVFAVDPKSGKLTAVEQESTGGKTPRHFAIDPSGKWLLAENQGSSTINVFQLDPKTGHLAPTPISLEVGSPVCLVFASR